MISLLTTGALAASVNVTLCVQYDVDLADSDVAAASEDTYHTNGTKDAHGIRIEVEGPFSTQVQYARSWFDPGCADFTLDNTATYTVRVKSQVELLTSSKKVSVRNGQSGGLFEHEFGTSWTPVAGTHTLTLPSLPRWNALAVAGLALYVNSAGLSSYNLDIFVKNGAGNWTLPGACSGSGSCINGTNLWLQNDDADLKFRTTYLLGWVLLQSMGYDRSAEDFGADDTNCSQDGGASRLGSLEFTRAGFLDGFAYWYAASTFNYAGTDCSFVYSRQENWDQLSLCHAELEADVGHVLSCAEGPSLPPYFAIVPTRNYRQYCLDRSPSVGIGGAPNPFPNNTVVPLDVVRFLRERTATGTGLLPYEVGLVMADVLSDTSAGAFRAGLRTSAVSNGANGSDWDDGLEEHGLDQ